MHVLRLGWVGRVGGPFDFIISQRPESFNFSLLDLDFGLDNSCLHVVVGIIICLLQFNKVNFFLIFTLTLFIPGEKYRFVTTFTIITQIQYKYLKIFFG